MKQNFKTRSDIFLFPEIEDSRLRDNNTFLYLQNSKELERYFELLISLYPITDGRMLHITSNLKWEIDNIWRNNGAEYTVTYLKEAYRLLQFFVAGNPQKSSLPCMIGAPKGLPSILPHGHRDLLLKASHRDYANVIRVIFALLGCYRLIVYKGVLKLNTITDISESQDLNPWEIGYCISTRFSNLFKSKLFEPPSYQLLSLTTAGPNNKISLLSATRDAIALRGSDILKDLQLLSEFFKSGVYSLLEKELNMLDTIKGNGNELLGKLSIKEEPAGKRRVFAIVDIWTQSILKPMHDHIYSILKLIREDGAFDQIRPVKELIKLNGKGKTFCYDLSAATDRFPISIQVAVLSLLYNREVALAWKQVLVNRPYYLSETKQSYIYGAGQPMGALSSWGVFSLCHHVIVQIAAMRVGFTKWFSEYALLGDDIVITNPLVAEMYYNIMVNELKVSINISKSLQSDIGVMEFAKRIIGPMGDYSPVGPKNLALMLRNKLNLPSLLVDLRDKGISIDYFLVYKLFTKWKRTGLFKFTWTEVHAFVWSLCKPFGFIESHTISPQKWVDKLSDPNKVVGNLHKLLEFLKEEWSLQHEKALASVKDALDSYDGFVELDNIFIHSSLIPSLMEQKSKLFTEFQRLSALPYPEIKVQYIPKPKARAMWMNFDSSFGMSDPMEAVEIDNMYHSDRFEITINKLLPGNTSIVKTFMIDSKPEYVLSQILSYLLNTLPPVTPITSPVSANDIRSINRSIRHVNYRFLKKFLNFSHVND